MYSHVNRTHDKHALMYALARAPTRTRTRTCTLINAHEQVTGLDSSNNLCTLNRLRDWHKIKSMPARLGQATGNMASRAGQATGSMALRAGQATGNMAFRAGKVTGDVALKAGKATGDMARNWNSQFSKQAASVGQVSRISKQVTGNCNVAGKVLIHI